jgi:hypothetical protein
VRGRSLFAYDREYGCAATTYNATHDVLRSNGATKRVSSLYYFQQLFLFRCPHSKNGVIQ